jgi:hypothetical protein
MVTYQQVFYVLYAVVLIQILIFIAVAKLTPAFTFLGAKLLKRSVKGVKRPDGFIDFVMAKEESGALTDKKYKIHYIGRNSANIETRSKLPFYLAHSGTSNIVSLDVQQVLDHIEEKGLNTIRYKEFKKFLKKNVNRKIIVPLWKTFKLPYLSKYLASSSNPGYIDNIIQHKVIAHTKKTKISSAVFTFGIIAMIVGAIAFAIIMRSKPAPVDVICQTATTAAQTSVANVSNIPGTILG